MAATSSVSRIAAWVSGLQERPDTAPQGLGEDRQQRQHEEQRQEAQRKRDQRPANGAWFAECPAITHDRTCAG